MLNQWVFKFLALAALGHTNLCLANDFSWYRQSGSGSVWYQVGNEHFLLQLADDGSVFYQQGNQLKEPPLETVYRLYQKRLKEKEAGYPLTKERLGFLRNPRYRQFFNETKPASTLSIKNEHVEQITGGQSNRVLRGPDGRLFVFENVSVNGAWHRVARSLDPQVLVELMGIYARSSAPSKFDLILKNAENQRDVNWVGSLPKPVVLTYPHTAPQVAAPKSVHAGAQSPVPSLPIRAKEVRQVPVSPPKKENLDPGPKPVPPVSTLRSDLPDWVTAVPRYQRIFKKYPDPKTPDFVAMGLSKEYSEARTKLDKKAAELLRMMSYGVSSERIAEEIERARELSDEIQKIWSRSGLDWINWNPEHQKQYEKDLLDFENFSIGARFLRLHSALMEKKKDELASNRKAAVPFIERKSKDHFQINVAQKPSLTRLEEKELRLQAVEKLLDESREDSVYHLSVLKRLNTLSPKYPGLQEDLERRRVARKNAADAE